MTFWFVMWWICKRWEQHKGPLSKCLIDYSCLGAHQTAWSYSTKMFAMRIRLHSEHQSLSYWYLVGETARYEKHKLWAYSKRNFQPEAVFTYSTRFPWRVLVANRTTVQSVLKIILLAIKRYLDDRNGLAAVVKNPDCWRIWPPGT